MGNQLDSILIRDNKGGFKTVNLGVGVKDSVVRKLQPTTPVNIQKSEQEQPVEEEKIILKEAPRVLPKSETLPPIKIQPIKNEPVEKVAEKIVEKPKEEEYLKIESRGDAAPSFYFDLDDEGEVLRFKDKAEIKKQKIKEEVIDFLTEKILDQSTMVNADLHERLRWIAESRLREVRNLLETKEILMKPVANGGLALTKEQTQQILKIIEEKRVALESKNSEQILAEAEKQKISVQPRPMEMKPIASRAPINLPKKEEAGRPSVENRFDLSQAMRGHSTQEITNPYVRQTPWPNMPAPKPAPVNFEKIAERRRTMGPVEELANFDLETFRMLAPNAQQVIDEIREKIMMLQEESFDKKAEGIKAWRSSPVYQDYLSIGQESLESNLSVEQTILNRQKNNRPTLSWEEFQAVADLNQGLSF
jgi:hypothetical protein